MKFFAGRSAGAWMVTVLCGCIGLAWLAQYAGAQNHTSVPVTRLYTGADGQTHAEEMETKFVPRSTTTAGSTGGGDKYEQADMVKATGAQVVRAAPGYVQDWHTAPRRQYVITISGRGEVELAGGKKILMAPGRILLVEDVTGKGHLTRTVGNQDRVSIIVPLAE
jgi:quercetin dioxygenase-like cupin family protein